MSDIVWGYGYEVPKHQGVCLWVYADCSARPPLDDVFELVALKLAKGDHEFTPRFAKVFQSVVVIGYERAESPEVELHEAYNRMWAKCPDLWERIQLRGHPMTLWAVDREDRAFFGVIQPARNRDFIQVFGADCLKYPGTPLYHQDDTEWALITAPIHPTTLAQARVIRAQA